MKRPFLCAIVLVVFGLSFLGFAGPAQATLLSIVPTPPASYTGVDTEAIMSGYLGQDVSMFDKLESYKPDPDGDEEYYIYTRNFPGWEVYDKDPDLGGQPLEGEELVKTAYVQWDLRDYPGYQMLAIVIKAGPQWWYYPVSEDQWIVGGGTVTSPVVQEISHITAYGVPEPIGMFLMGAGLMTWGVIHRRKVKGKRIKDK